MLMSWPISKPNQVSNFESYVEKIKQQFNGLVQD